MRCLALATDYDGTLATHGEVDAATIAALERFAASGRKLLLVTGRELPDLLGVFPGTELFDRIIAENGALLHRPQISRTPANLLSDAGQKAESAVAPHVLRSGVKQHVGSTKLLCEPPPERLVQLLRERNVPFSVGRAIIATREPYELAVLEAIRELGLELHVIFNKGAVMVLPSGVNKGSGLRRGLDELGLSPHAVAGIGDAENDHALLSACQWGVAVANALPAIKQRAAFVTTHAHGAGVAELMDRILRDDLP